MYQALSRHAEVVPLGRPYMPTRLRQLWEKFENSTLRRTRAASNGEEKLRRFGRLVERQLDEEYLDVVFAPVASQELTVVAPKQPVVYASDATCQLLYNNYDFGVSADQLAEEEKAERLAIQNSTGITYSSAWAAESAIRDYGAPKEKVRVIPYGPNLVILPDSNEIYDKCDRRPWKIVFLGMYWHRKGGDIALKAFETLLNRGVDAELTFIGAGPPEGHGGLPVRVAGFLDKRKARDRETLREILLSSHLMLFPSRADCSPVSLCEAAAYGIPAVASDVGGISTIVTERTGRLMPSDSTAEDYAEAMLELIRNPKLYREMIRSSRQRYEEVLNWDKWAETLVAFCRELV